MKVTDIITRDPKCVGPDTTLVEATRIMKSLDIGMLPICENDRLIGTLTDRDIAVRAVAEGFDPNVATVRQVMTPELAYCFDDQSVAEAAHLMENWQVRRLAVLDRNKRLVGIISLGDLAVRTHEELLAAEVLERVSEPAHAVW